MDIKLLTAGLLILAINTVSGYPNGAPASQCSSMVPGHGVSSLDILKSPYTIKVGKTDISSSEKLEIEILASEETEAFTGFLVQVRDDNDNIIGSFPTLVDEYKHVKCTADKDAVTHRGSEGKTSVKLSWKPPADFTGTVKVLATVVKDFASFYVKVPSEPVTVGPPNPDAAPAAEPEPESEPEPEPESEPEPEPEGVESDSEAFVGCAQDKNCFGSPSGCENTKTCDYMFTWKLDGDKMVWEGYRKGSGYVAVGVSEDSKMGKDIMFICSQSGVKEYTSAGKSAPTPSSENQLNTITTTNIGGDMYCKFESGTLLVSKGIDFSADLKNEKYHILVAQGDGELSYHAQNKIGSGEPSALGLVQAQGSSSKVLLKVHGLAMIAAWIGCAGTGMMIARYFKNTWKGTKVLGTDVWFTAHRSLMMSTVLFTAIGLILVMIHNKGWNYTAESIRNNPHPALGLATVILAFMQPVMAMFRPHPGTKFRPIFNWGHTIVGNAAFSIGIAAIFLSGDLPAIRIEYKGYVACLIVYIIVYTLVQLFLVFHNLMMERSEARTEVHPMAEKGGEVEDTPVENKDKPGSKIRQIVLLLFILFSLAVSISLIVAIFKFD